MDLGVAGSNPVGRPSLKSTDSSQGDGRPEGPGEWRSVMGDGEKAAGARREDGGEDPNGWRGFSAAALLRQAYGGQAAAATGKAQWNDRLGGALNKRPGSSRRRVTPFTCSGNRRGRHGGLGHTSLLPGLPGLLFNLVIFHRGFHGAPINEAGCLVHAGDHLNLVNSPRLQPQPH